MKKWNLIYELTIQFSKPICKHSYSLRCFPRETEIQKLISCEDKITPYSGISRSRDSFGNTILHGKMDDFHELFSVRVHAVVVTMPGHASEPLETYRLGMFRGFTDLTRAGETLRLFYKENHRKESADPLEIADWWMNRLYNNFNYVSGSTYFRTMAEDAFSQGCGVCQDYAHILLSLLRQEGLIARYVAGCIPGEGQTHAWVEVWNGGCWVGYDPTHNRRTDENYICLAVGRDAEDCSLNRGVFVGDALQTQSIYVKMEESQIG